MPRTIIIADDNKIDRSILVNMLRNEYRTIEAESGEDALAAFNKIYKTVSAVILDKSMPGIDGFEVLKRIRNNALFLQIPVIIATASDDEKTKEKALELGANGFITKPYNFQLLISCLHNAISLRESASLANSLRLDGLTGLLNRDTFYTEAERLIKRHESGYYIMSCIDIDNFKVINDQYGISVGDKVLCHISKTINDCVSGINGISCRFSADRFAVLYPAAFCDDDIVLNNHDILTHPECIKNRIRVRIGRYLITVPSEKPNAMYDRAALAEESIKNKYDAYIAVYNDSMRTELLHEQYIVTNMYDALENDEFKVWLQPQVNHVTGALIGAEALVRWEKDGELISPTEFIPVFERNGFIYEMDKFIWEKVCMLIRRWLDEGKNPLPVSVNISRRDIYHKHFIEVITDLVKKYEIPVDLIRFEVTESAFADSTNLIVSKVDELIKLGFTVEIDDFGSGYSSLNTLKDVPASILKLDMKFFENTKNSQRGGNIIESVVRMAKWLGMSVIAEGVEDKAQADYLKTIGCYYIQGYCYSKPISVAEYEKFFEESVLEPKLPGLKTIKTLDNNEFWNPKSMETLIFNSYVGGACIFEYYRGKFELLRMNDQYTEQFRGIIPEGCQLIDAGIIRFLDAEEQKILVKTVNSALRSNKEATCEIKVSDGICTEYIRITIRVIARTGDRVLCYSVVLNMTEQRLAEKNEKIASERIKAILDNSQCGVTAVVLPKKGKKEFLFVNNRFYQMLGYTKRQFEKEINDPFGCILPEDKSNIISEVMKLHKIGDNTSLKMRVLRRDKSIVWLRADITIVRFANVSHFVQLSNFTDITVQEIAEQKQLEAADKLRTVLNSAENGITAAIIKGTKAEFLFVNDKFYEIHGVSREEYGENTIENLLSIVYNDDRKIVIDVINNSINTGCTSEITYRVKHISGRVLWIKAIISVTNIVGIDKPVQISVFSDITDEKEMNEQLSFINDSAHTILSQPDSELAITETLTKLMNYFSADRGYVVELDNAKCVSNNTYEVCAEGVTRQINNLQNLPFDKSDYWYKVISNNNFLVINNINELDDSLSELRDLLESQGIFSIVLSPLCRNGEIIGFMGIDNPTRALNHINQLNALSDYIAVLLTRRDLDKHIERSNSNMKLMINDTPGGFCRMEIHEDKNPTLISLNSGFCNLLDMTEEEVYSEYGSDMFKCLVSEDIASATFDSKDVHFNGGQFRTKCRLRKKSGDYIWAMVIGRFVENENRKTFLNSYFTDISQQVENEKMQKNLLDNLAVGVALYEYDGEKLNVIHINKSYWKLVKREPVDYSEVSVLSVVHPDDVKGLTDEISSAVAENRNINISIRIKNGNGCYTIFHITANIERQKNKKYLIYATYEVSDKL